jgi:hypothetical protein
MFCVASARFDVRFLNSPSESSRSLPARSTADVEEEPDQERGADGQQRGHQHAVAVGLEDAEHHEEHADRRQDGPERVERTRWIGCDGISYAAAEHYDGRNDRRLEDERGPPANRARNQAPEQRPRRGADAAHAADHTERPRARREIAEMQRCEDVDGRDQ